MERVLSVAEPRVRLLLTLAATTGLRLAELVHLRGATSNYADCASM